MTRTALAAALLLVAVGCDSPNPVDASVPDAGGRPDAGPPQDGGAIDGRRDGGARGDDAGLETDAGPVAREDAGASCGADLVGDAPDAASELGAIADDDSYPAGSESVVLGSRGDIDWYTYTVSDGPLGNLEPRVTLTELPGDARYELCLYFECDTDLQSVGCEEPAVAHEISAERHGCCITGTGTELEVKLTPIRCTGFDESGRVFARVSQQTGAPICTAYDLAWGDD